MADSGIGPSNGSGEVGRTNGGQRVAGQRSAATESHINKDRESIQKKWNIAKVEDAFPEAIKPSNLGLTAIQKLKAIANKVNNLAVAQALFLNEAKKPDGVPVPFGFAHASRILESLKANETLNMTPDNKGSEQPTLKSASTTPQKKTTTSQSTPAKIPDLFAPGSNLKDPFSIGKAQTPPKKAPTARMTEESPTFAHALAAPIASRKRRAQNGTGDHQEAVAKKVRMENQALSPKNTQHNTMAQPKSTMDILKKRTNEAQLPAKTDTSVTDAMNDKSEALGKLVEEETRANEEFFAHSEARRALYSADTIRVAHPSDMPQSFVKNEQSKSTSSLLPIDHKLVFQSPEILPKADLKEEYLKLAETLILGANSLHKLAGPDQQPLVGEVKRVLAQVAKRMKMDLEYIFDIAKSG